MLKDFLLFCEFLVGFVGLVVFLAAAGVAIGSFLGALAGSAVYIYDVIGSVRIAVSGEVIPGAAQRGCPLYLRCSMPDLMR